MTDTTASTEPGTLVRHDRTDGGVDVLTLQHGKVNALSSAVLAELRATVGQLRAGGSRAVVVTGGPKVFAAGADISEFAEQRGQEEGGQEERGQEEGGQGSFRISPAERVAEIGDGFLQALNDLAALPCPTIAAVNGVALGGGCELALACDLRVASDRARFGQPEILLGIIPGGGGTQRLARLVGPARAKDMVLSGRTVDAAEASAIGLVDRVTEGDALDAALELATAFARGPQAAQALAKKAIDGGLELSLADGLVLEQQRFVESFGTDDAVVGVQSFLRDGPGKARFA